MKRKITLILVLAMCLSLVACGGKAAVESQLQGTWRYTASGGGVVIYIFDNGTYENILEVDSFKLPFREGKYEITDDAIILLDENGENDAQLTYSMEKNNLILGDGIFQKVD